MHGSDTCSNINLPPPTLLPEVPVPPPTATITSTQAQQQKSTPNNRHVQPTSTNEYQDQNISHSKQNFMQNKERALTKPLPVHNLPPDPTNWTVDHVVRHLSFLDPTLGPHVEMFRTHEIDGKALLLLNEEMMMTNQSMLVF